MAALNADNETFPVYIAVLVGSTTMLIYLSCQVKIAPLTSEQTGISAGYSDFSNVFSSNSAAELPKYIGINDYSINLLYNKQQTYNPIYSLASLELETLKTCIKAKLASNFIRPFEFPTGVPILFFCKKNDSFCLCIGYWGFNNLTIKNSYLLPLIVELLNCSGRTKHFTQLDPINTYHWIRIKKNDKYKIAL